MTSGTAIIGQNIEDERQQRSSLILKNVRYRIYAKMSMTDKSGHGDTNSEVCGCVFFVGQRKDSALINYT